MTQEKLLLLDGNSLAYRAFFALPPLTNSQGIHTNSVYGFTTMLQKILEEEQPTHILVAFDAGKTTFRHSTYTEYKGGRQKTPPELSEQFPYLRKLVEAYNMKRYELENYEADDIIGTLARQAESRGLPVVVISGDKDLTQLATDNTTVYITRKGMTDIEHYTPAHIEEKYGLKPLQIIDMKGLMGDASDNIPGVPGVGEKTAIKLLKEHPSVEEVYENIDAMKASKMKEKLVANKEQALMSKELATILLEAPIEVKVDDLKWDGPNVDELFTLWKELDFKTLIEKSEYESEEHETMELDYKIVDDLTDKELVTGLAIHLEIENEHYHTALQLGVAFVNEEQAYFVTYENVLKSESIKNYLEDEQKVKYVFDLKKHQAAFARDGIKLQGIEFDLLLAAYIDDPAFASDDVAAVSNHYHYSDIQSNEVVYGKGAKRTNPEGEALAEHACRQALAVFTVRDRVLKKLHENEQFDLYNEIELPLAKVLAGMEIEGIRVEASTLEEMGVEIKARLAEIEANIYAAAGEKFNINSPKQLGVVLFETLGLPVIKKTKTGYSTAADVLDKLKPEHDIIEHILQYRQLGKLQSTYIEGLTKEIHADDHKIHTRYQQALTATGRLSSTDPNLQNIPIRLEEGRKIRQAFIPEKEGWQLFAADYSQIELRVLAHMSQDENLMQAFLHGLDIHTNTAMKVFHVEEDAVTSNMRRAAKAVNFGIVYGISDYGLSQNLDISRKEAAEFIERYFESFPGVKTYMEDIVKEAKSQGYVTTLLNRRRYLPDLNSSNFNLRSFAERTAMNTPIQGSAADIIKKAMIDMDLALKEHKLQAKMLLQVHDELIFEAPVEEIAILEKLVPEVMANTVKLDVPLLADYSAGNTWYDAK
ncbi:DNA polymerase I [Kurthia zopfii]|uniref:DNA polymerase I n=1 Tax=Kurthia zopfii TaxID=1650 RepID=A0A8B4QC49_9BACL|nr:DNA polymerase I [Kurthia zopfii]PWI23078.1 DNA polymerase I [Kurthia zopfii]TDR40540.1 DNA polymerase I [Kurthia zopfii]GEK30099.1 DNA polymerase I [Kurthia zopfii]STX10279.1 DNA polymerase I [Kurthia zopfii]